VGVGPEPLTKIKVMYKKNKINKFIIMYKKIKKLIKAKIFFINALTPK
jgi:hypothetical protein